MFGQRTGVKVAILILNVTAAVNAYGQQYPTKPIRLVVPYAAGGTSDVIGRILGERLGSVLGQPMVIDNRGGAGGFIGCEMVAKAPPDGYALLIMTSSTHAAEPAMFRKMPFDPINDFAPISQLTLAPTLLTVPASLPANSVAEFVTLAKAKLGRLNYASSGTGGTAHLAAELFLQRSGASMTHVPYKGAGPAVTDLIGGHVQMFFDTILSVLPHIKTGKLKALAVSSLARSSTLPDLPTVAETYPGFEVTNWQGIEAPAGTPRAIIDKLNAGIAKVMAMQDVRERILNLGADPVSSTPEQFAQFIDREKQKWADVVKRAGIPPMD